jgi:transmembrane 9 superfamily protein 2/4
MLKENGTCKVLCVVEDVTDEEAKFINDRIKEDYALNWLVDGLPAAEMKIDRRNNDTFFDMGFNLGNNEGQYQNAPVLNNHYDIVLRYSPTNTSTRQTANALKVSSANARQLSCRWRPCMAIEVR